MRGIVNLDSIFALMLFLIFFGFVSNYVLQMSGRSQSHLDLRSAADNAYAAILADGALVDVGERTPVLVVSESARQDYFWLKWGNASLSVPSVYDPVFGEVVGLASLSGGENNFLLANGQQSTAGNISFSGASFSNSYISLNISGMNISGLTLGNAGIAGAIFLGPEPAQERLSQTPLRVKIAGGNYSWNLFSNHSGFVLEYEAAGVSALLNISIALDPSLTNIYTNETRSCANFSKETDFADFYGSRGLAVSGDVFNVSCSDGAAGILKSVSLSGNESRVFRFRFYAHEGGYQNALAYRGLLAVRSGLPYGTKVFSPLKVSAIGSAYCGSMRDSVNPNLGLWLSFTMGNGTYECKTDSPSRTQDVAVSKKAVAYTDGGRGLLYVRVWYK